MMNDVWNVLDHVGWGEREGGENKTVPQHPPPRERVRVVVVL